MIIAIDGPSGTGKSTIARLLAKRIDFVYFNTGALYRALAYDIINKRRSLDREEEVLETLSAFDFDIRDAQGDYAYYLDGENITDKIWQEKISLAASTIAKNKHVREKLLPIQRTFSKKKNVVFEGRDIGTVVFPDADLKIFLNANSKVRAERRLNQLKEKYPEKVSTFHFEEILKDVIARDKQDTSRKVAPLKKAENAIEIDTSDLNIDQILDKIVELINNKDKK